MSAAEGSRHCAGCGGQHEHDLAATRCAFLTATRKEIAAAGARAENPPSGAQVIDLWAHLREIRDDGAVAARAVQAVLDLGWRPVVGMQA